MDLVDQGYWDSAYEGFNIDINTSNDPVAGILNKYLSNGKGKSVLEIGCFPGRYLKTFGELQYELNGVDTTPKTTTLLNDFFVSKGYRIGKIRCESIFDFSSSEKFEVVCSFGFIEHFQNWKSVVDVHLQHLKPGGILILTVPNFSGVFQYIFHKIFDKKNLKRHNLKAMNVNKWLHYIKSKKLGHTVLFKGPFGEIDFWVDEEPTSTLKIKMKNKWFQAVNFLKRKKLPVSDFYAPYKGVIIKFE